MSFPLSRPLSRLALGLALAAACASDAAFAQDAPPPATTPPAAPAPTLSELVANAQSAFEQKREKPFAALVAAIEGDFDIDPWIIADGLAAAGNSDFARAFAAAGSGPRWQGLDEYLAGAEAAEPRPDEAKLQSAVVAALRTKDGVQVLELTAGLAKEAVPGTVLALDTLCRRADVLFDAGRGAETLALANDVADRTERIGWIAGLLRASVAEGRGAQDPPQLDVLRTAYARAADLAQRLGNAVEEGQALINLAVVHVMTGDYASALDAMERSVRANDRAPPSYRRSRDRVMILTNLGELLARMGEAAGARVALDAAIETLRASGADRASGELGEPLRSAFASLCNARLLTGDVVGALATLRELTELALAAHDVDALAQAAALEGKVRRESGEWALALEAFRSARDKFAERSDETLRLRAAASMGYCLRELGRPREAIDLLRPTIEAQERLPDPEVLPDARRELGEALAAIGEKDEALRLYGEALAGALALAQREDAARTRIALAETMLAMGDARGALAAASSAAEDVPGLVRDTAQTDAAQTRRRWVRCYDVGLRAALELGDADAVMRFLEAGRAGALLEGLRGRALVAADPGLLRESAVRHRARAGAELALADAVMSGAALKDIAARRATLTSAESAERETIARIQRGARTAAKVAYPAPIEVATACADLASNEALVIFRALAERTVAVVLTHAETRVVTLAGAASWQPDAARLASPENKDPERRDAAATLLRDALVRPLGLGADCTRVLVSPDGALATAPLCLLFPGRAVAFVPSATALHALRAAPPTGGTTMLAVGDPDYARESKLATLPGSRIEVESLPGPKVTLLGAEATPQRFAAALAKGVQWRAVHLACHGVPDARDPWSSAVALSAARDAGGRLTALEMAALPIRADLVTLSACELAGGRTIGAEGAVGVPQALLVAGARCVLASLWRADDDAAQLLMKTFYEEWRAGGSGAAEALRVAQARVRGDPRWRDSWYWAGWGPLGRSGLNRARPEERETRMPKTRRGTRGNDAGGTNFTKIRFVNNRATSYYAVYWVNYQNNGSIQSAMYGSFIPAATVTGGNTTTAKTVDLTPLPSEWVDVTQFAVYLFKNPTTFKGVACINTANGVNSCNIGIDCAAGAAGAAQLTIGVATAPVDLNLALKLFVDDTLSSQVGSTVSGTVEA